MSMRPTDDQEYIRETQRSGRGGNPDDADVSRPVAFSGGDGGAIPPAGTMSREFTEVFGYLFRRFFGFFMFPYRIGRRIGGRLR